MKKNNKKGFTLAELLIVVAIIAVLVAIAIPVFTTQLEKSREAVDASNIRAAYAEIMANAITGDGETTKTLTMKGEVAGWQNTFEFPSNLAEGTATVASKGSVTISLNDTKDGCTASVKLTKES